MGYGDYLGTEGPTHALLWSGSATSAVDLNPTLLSNITSSVALGVGGNEQVGYGNTGQNAQALLWTGTANSAVDLNPTGFITSNAKATNGDLQVGFALTSALVENAMLWSGTAASAVDLQAFLPAGITWSSSAASSIDANGDIFGTARGTTGGVTSIYAVEWTTVPGRQRLRFLY